MAQYTTISTGNPLEITNNIDTFRYNVSSSLLYLDKEITSLGFDGAENVDWASITAYTGGGLGIFRLGVRSLHWVMDEILTPTGFIGDENIDWKNVQKHKAA